MGMQDGWTVLLILLLIGVCAVFGFIMAANAFPYFAGMDGIPSDFVDNMKSVFTIMDGAFGIALVLLMIGAVYVATLSRSHPFLAVIGLFFMIFMVFGGYFIQIFWQEFASGAPEVVSAVAEFPIINSVLSNLAPLGLLVDLALLVAYFVRPGAGTVSTGGY